MNEDRIVKYSTGVIGIITAFVTSVSLYASCAFNNNYRAPSEELKKPAIVYDLTVEDINRSQGISPSPKSENVSPDLGIKVAEQKDPPQSNNRTLEDFIGLPNGEQTDMDIQDFNKKVIMYIQEGNYWPGNSKLPDEAKIYIKTYLNDNQLKFRMGLNKAVYHTHDIYFFIETLKDLTDMDGFLHEYALGILNGLSKNIEIDAEIFTKLDIYGEYFSDFSEFLLDHNELDEEKRESTFTTLQEIHERICLRGKESEAKSLFVDMTFSELFNRWNLESCYNPN
ncbi:hypothetical protein ACFLZX_02255 [Nanoarchaeota archaeon]